MPEHDNSLPDLESSKSLEAMIEFLEQTIESHLTGGHLALFRNSKSAENKNLPKMISAIYQEVSQKASILKGFISLIETGGEKLSDTDKKNSIDSIKRNLSIAEESFPSFEAVLNILKIYRLNKSEAYTENFDLLSNSVNTLQEKIREAREFVRLRDLD